MGYVCPFLKKGPNKMKNRMKTFRIKEKIQDYLTQTHQKFADKKSAVKKLAY